MQGKWQLLSENLKRSKKRLDRALEQKNKIGKKPGAQKGHIGTTLKKVNDQFKSYRCRRGSQRQTGIKIPASIPRTDQKGRNRVLRAHPG